MVKNWIFLVCLLGLPGLARGHWVVFYPEVELEKKTVLWGDLIELCRGRLCQDIREKQIFDFELKSEETSPATLIEKLSLEFPGEQFGTSQTDLLNIRRKPGVLSVKDFKEAFQKQFEALSPGNIKVKIDSLSLHSKNYLEYKPDHKPAIVFVDLQNKESEPFTWLIRKNLRRKTWGVHLCLEQCLPTNVKLSYQLELKKLLTRRELGRQQSIQNSDFYYGFVPVKTQNIAALMDLKSLEGKVAARHLRVDSVVFSKDFVEPILVERGDLVSVDIQKGRLAISSKGKALTSGKKGERVQVSLEGHRKIVHAVVAEKGVLQFEL